MLSEVALETLSVQPQHTQQETSTFSFISNFLVGQKWGRYFFMPINSPTQEQHPKFYFDQVPWSTIESSLTQRCNDVGTCKHETQVQTSHWAPGWWATEQRIVFEIYKELKKSLNYACKKKKSTTYNFSNNTTILLGNWSRNKAAQQRDHFLLITAQNQAGWRRETGNLSISVSRMFVYTASAR